METIEAHFKKTLEISLFPALSRGQESFSSLFVSSHNPFLFLFSTLCSFLCHLLTFSNYGRAEKEVANAARRRHPRFSSCCFRPLQYHQLQTRSTVLCTRRFLLPPHVVSCALNVTNKQRPLKLRVVVFSEDSSQRRTIHYGHEKFLHFLPGS